MKVTFTLRNITESGYAGLAAMSDDERFKKLTDWAFGDLRHCVSVKYGASNAFRDRVEVNGLMKRPHRIEYSLSPRRGYNLATFEITQSA